ncbi:MAG: ribosome maturation factor RimP [Clostridia bacterium]|nr:ribosome maturation factor RimP [Clostridia bacterium]
MAKGGSTVQTVCALAQPVANELGVSLWDVRFLKEGATWVLRIFIDKQGGVSIDDCVDFTHAINPVLDAADPIEQAYCLEVSSPGIERELTRAAHFEACRGQKIKLRTIRPVDGARDFSGVLEDYADGVLTLRFSDGGALTLDKKETAWVKLDDFEGFGD